MGRGRTDSGNQPLGTLHRERSLVFFFFQQRKMIRTVKPSSSLLPKRLVTEAGRQSLRRVAGHLRTDTEEGWNDFGSE